MPLERILQSVSARAPGAARAVAIFDLDSTLYSTQARNHAILREYVAHPDAAVAVRAAAARLELRHMGWNPMDDVRQAGCDDERGLRHLRRYWFERFFTSDYLHHDEPLPGAPGFVRELHAAGGIVVYLTGRPAAEMGPGTRRSLHAHGFPLDDGRAHLMLKPTFDEPDLDFKRAALEPIAALGEVVAGFENEPANANLFAERFPAADIVFLDTIHSPNAPPLHPRITRRPDFSRR